MVLADFITGFKMVRERFGSRMLQKIIDMLFNEAVRRIVASFEGRAKALYGGA